MADRKTDMNGELNFLDHIVKTQFLKTGLYEYQKDFYWRLRQKEFNIINKSRQIGISFFYAGLATIWAMEGETQIIISNSERQSKNVMNYIDMWINGISKCTNRLDVKIKERNKTRIDFDGGAPIYALPNSPSTIRGISAGGGRLFLDEFGHFEHNSDKQIWEALLPSISRGNKKSVCINSTPFGEGNMYYEMCNNRNQFPDFNYVFYSYRECPDINIDVIKRNMDSLSFSQEYEGAFLGDINTYYPFSITRGCINSELEYLLDLNSVPYPLYVAADIGRRRDFTAIIVLADTGSKLRVVYKKVLKSMEEKEWKNQYALLRTVLSCKRVVRAYIDAGFGQEMVETLQGEYSSVVPFTFTNENKAQMHPAFRKRLENKGLEIPEDMEIINSLHLIQRKQSGNSVVYESDKRTDEHGHADLGVALVLANWCYDKDANTVAKFMTPEIYTPNKQRAAFREASFFRYTNKKS